MRREKRGPPGVKRAKVSGFIMNIQVRVIVPGLVCTHTSINPKVRARAPF